MSTDAPAAMDTIVLPLLENISLSFPSDQEMHYYPCFLSILDFPNVINIDVKFTAKKYWLCNPTRAGQRSRAFATSNGLEQLKLSLSITLKRGLGTLDVRLRFATSRSAYERVCRRPPETDRLAWNFRVEEKDKSVSTGGKGLKDPEASAFSERGTPNLKNSFTIIS